ncbi:MAG: Hsp20/alpha crystallin family protein [Anaerolineae bacterium]|nr:Hsp20/alpha crystallin family protein [Anaerolineae bacterium]
MTLVRWSPAYRHLHRVAREMADYQAEAGGTRSARLPVDVYSTESEIVVSAMMPGVSPEDVEITFEGDILTIRGTVATRDEDESPNFIIREQFTGTFSRTLRLGVPVESEKIDASMENGILTVRVPKAEEARARVIKVNAR